MPTPRKMLICALAALLFCGAMPDASRVRAQTASEESRSIDAIRRDLGQLDRQVMKAAVYQGGIAGEALPGTDGQPIKPREVYATYLTKADSLSTRLIKLGEQLKPKGDTSGMTPPLSLQQLGALTQRLSAENVRFRDSFKHGEDQFESYRLIQTAIYNLEDTITYWRLANRYRRLYRGLEAEKQADDEVLRTKLQAAMQAIDRLKAIQEMRVALNALDREAYP